MGEIDPQFPRIDSLIIANDYECEKPCKTNERAGGDSGFSSAETPRHVRFAGLTPLAGGAFLICG
ncbi:MAG TPA: hypothetical protein VN829_21075 [Dongiaceae bacterium]|nr:hypothetical protein [Dongiaceae bacterium]